MSLLKLTPIGLYSDMHMDFSILKGWDDSILNLNFKGMGRRGGRGQRTTNTGRMELKNVDQIVKTRRKKAKVHAYQEHRRQENLKKKAKAGGKAGGRGGMVAGKRGGRKTRR